MVSFQKLSDNLEQRTSMSLTYSVLSTLRRTVVHRRALTRANAPVLLAQKHLSGRVINETLLPEYKPRVGEDMEVKRARLLYQSRKRGMLENGLLLRSFAAKYLPSFSSNQLDQYDHLINTPSNDWQLYYWFTGREETPSDYNNEVMDLIKKHTQTGNFEDN